ncbi:MAG TPA: peptidase M23 [Deltaproteobacteria bacterium]|nr:MAG: hypothetical protein A3I81_06545 [Deltaproteobacteria bacterium RIFCSPLOWO2_02_FULL_55_12]OIJ72919.1 MAG: hypothetical protein A2V21_300785 [Deltaproteobacteria bacterium GWC2_55_46]HBG46079.1 peptidase M23 [Deltaproteobacteria bacterium]HCY11703.1 peptidase M23 [Deltaproteobacteria bacterium]
MPISRVITFLAAFLFIAFLIYGCAPGVYHKVNKGETFWRICKTYGADMQEVAELNDIKDPTAIKAGSKFFIPGASRLRKVKPFVPPSPGAKDEEAEGAIVVESGRFDWPLKGEMISPYGLRNGVKHGGIDIKAKEGTPVLAADSGEAIYVESGMRGYGKIIILKHKDDFFTVYAHNSENLVKHGEKVERGARIAAVGRSGNATTAHLHFEVRQGKAVRNPLFFLP